MTDETVSDSELFQISIFFLLISVIILKNSEFGKFAGFPYYIVYIFFLYIHVMETIKT